MKPSKLLRQAAMNLEREHLSNKGKIKSGCCGHIRIASGAASGLNKDFWEARSYFSYLSPRGRAAYCDYWYGNPNLTPNTNERVLALLFAAAIAESEGR